MFRDFYRNRRVLVTGHTGFKGSWLTEWLLELGASVCGLALPPDSENSLFTELEIRNRVSSHTEGDIRDEQLVQRTITDFCPEIVFHLAAQPLVRESYLDPIGTITTNVVGTAHILNALRRSNNAVSVVVITTDKCYENREWLHPYREEDRLGGHDPYSASKAAAEILISSFRKSFFSNDSNVRVSSARAGNVIGGGDWAKDRIVPDCIRMLRQSQPIPIRNRHATRPWQHVLEPLSGYLWLGALLASPHPESWKHELRTSFNFGPHIQSNRTVGDLTTEILKHWSGAALDATVPNAPHEASLLNLSIEKAFHVLNWTPTWNFPQTVRHTIDWYKRHEESCNPIDLTKSQIQQYISDSTIQGVQWTLPCNS